MTSLFSRYRNSNANNGNSGKDSKKKEKEEPEAELTPLEKMLQNASPVTEPDADKFFGLENFGNTCYCNSIVQALFYSETFRDCIINYPKAISANQSKVEITIRPPTVIPPIAPNKKNGASPPTPITIGIRPEDRPEAPEYKKKQAMLKGPILELTKEHTNAYDIGECTFTGLKDIFLALMDAKSRTGVLSPQRFLEIFKRDNEMFRNSMHQDAHEFYGIVLNDIISNLEAHSRKMLEASPSASLTTRNTDQGLVRNIFEGLLSSETKCLTCETVSKKDETFLDLSIDLDEHSSVTSCLSKFSEEEVLCERNKFQCDQCGGLQEAEKRMKIQRLPKILALHLKRFKYTEDFTRLQKLHHRVVYPSHLRLFNTTPQTADPDRVYELYAVVVHIGGNAYHGHYVSVIKTKERGWLLFDDEMVEPVDDNYVNNFFGDANGLACAYVLFYQETTVENARVLEEDNSILESGPEEAVMASRNSIVTDNGQADVPPVMRRGSVQPVGLDESMPSLAHSHTAPLLGDSHGALSNGTLPSTPLTGTLPPVIEDKKLEKKRLKEEKKQEVLEAHAAGRERRKLEEKQRKIESEERRREREEVKKVIDLSKKESEEKNRKASNGNSGGGSLLDRASWSSKSMSRKSLGFLSKKRDQEKDKSASVETPPAIPIGTPKPPSTSGTTTTTASNTTTATRTTATTANGSEAHTVGDIGASVSMTSIGTSSQAGPSVAGPAAASAAAPTPTSTPAPEKHDFRSRFTFGLGKKKSTPALS